jgi:hypothetical protein
MGQFIKPLASPQFLTQTGYAYKIVNLLILTTPITTLDLSVGDIFNGTMPSGDATLVLLNPRIASFRLEVAHAAAQYVLTFPTGYFTGQPGPIAYGYTMEAGLGKRTAFDMFYDGTTWRFSPLLVSV